ncbi:MAG: histidine phosphatase family protein [Candidatus Limnocylindrus sp.]
MSVIHLVRHGQASFGSHDYDRLSPLGQQQVQRLASHWQSLGDQPSALYCGPLRRQRQTAELLADGTALAITEHPDFKEFEASQVLNAYALAAGLLDSDTPPLSLERHQAATEGTPDPKDLRRFQQGLEAATLAWVRGELQGDFESWSHFNTRVIGALESVINATGRGQQVVVCTSAGVIGAVVGHVMGLQAEAAVRLSWVLLNASVSSILFDDRRRSIMRFNVLAHLEQPGYRNLLTRI